MQVCIYEPKLSSMLNDSIKKKLNRKVYKEKTE
jgi:hypothetical protein